jgi:nitrate reductase NapAB chaperone NapD
MREKKSMQTIEVNIPLIKYTEGIALAGKVRDGKKVYLLDGHTVEKIITQHMAQIKKLQGIIATNAIRGVRENEPHRTSGESRSVGQPDKTGGRGHGD